MKNSIVIALVSALVGLGIGYFVFNQDNLVSSISTSTSATFSTAKIAETGFAPATAAATTSTSLLNTDSTDRIITDAFAYCDTVGTSKTYLTGTGLASLTFAMGTTTNTSNSTANNTVYTLTVATSSANVYVASSTEPVLNAVGRIWPSGTYWLITANATNTAACVAGVHYLAS